MVFRLMAHDETSKQAHSGQRGENGPGYPQSQHDADLLLGRMMPTGASVRQALTAYSAQIGPIVAMQRDLKKTFFNGITHACTPAFSLSRSTR
jgi:hypothetical protein